MEDPERYLNEIHAELPSFDDPSKPAVIDRLHRASVNHEVYFFSTEAAREAFERDPVATCGLLTDPVSGKRFQPTKKSPRKEYRGRPFFFPSQASRKTFVSNPMMYANPHRTMPAPTAPAAAK